MRYVPSQPLQGMQYQRLQTAIAANYSGLQRPNNVGANAYAPMTGLAFQKPLSGSTTNPALVPNAPHR